jgi:Flp pilus assembly pilin Flp
MSGVTMTQFALILTAIAVVAYGSYRVLGNDIGGLVSGVDSTLPTAHRGAAQATPTPFNWPDARSLQNDRR